MNTRICGAAQRVRVRGSLRASLSRRLGLARLLPSRPAPPRPVLSLQYVGQEAGRRLKINKNFNFKLSV